MTDEPVPRPLTILGGAFRVMADSGADRIVRAIRPGVRPGDAAYAAMT